MKIPSEVSSFSRVFMLIYGSERLVEAVSSANIRTYEKGINRAFCSFGVFFNFIRSFINPVSGLLILSSCSLFLLSSSMIC